MNFEEIFENVPVWAILLVVALISVPTVVFRNASTVELGGKNPDKVKSAADASSSEDEWEKAEESKLMKPVYKNGG